MPNKIIGIAKWAFKYNRNFQSITIPSSVKKFECEAFETCNNIKVVLYEGSLEEWCNLSFDAKTTSSPLHNGSDLYINGTLLTDLVISEGILELSANSFAHCASITSVKIGASCQRIGENAFLGCANLVRLEVAEGVTEIGKSAFCDCKSLKEVTIAEGVSTIETLAFRGCSSLERIVIPSTIKKNDKYAFSHCDSLKEIVIKGTTELEKTAFNECNNIEKVTVSEELLENGFPWWKDHFGCTNAIIFGLKSFPIESKLWKYAKKNPQIVCEIILKKRRLDLLTVFLEEVKNLDSVITPDIVDIAKKCDCVEAIPLILNATNQEKIQATRLRLPI